MHHLTVTSGEDLALYPSISFSVAVLQSTGIGKLASVFLPHKNLMSMKSFNCHTTW